MLYFIKHITEVLIRTIIIVYLYKVAFEKLKTK